MKKFVTQIFFLSLSLTSWAQDAIPQAESTVDSLSIYKEKLTQTSALLTFRKVELDTLSKINLSLQKDIKEFKIMMGSLGTKVDQSENELNKTLNSLAQTETNLSKSKQRIATLIEDSLSNTQEILQLKFDIEKSGNENEEELSLKKKELDTALANLSIEKINNSNYQNDLRTEILDKESLQDNLRKITTEVINLSDETKLLHAKKDTLTRTVEVLTIQKGELLTRVENFKEQNTYFLATIYVGLAFILLVFIYIISRIAKTDDIDKQYLDISSKIKEEHPMLKETLTHYLRYKLYSRILRHALILVTSGTIIFISALVLIYFKSGEADKLFTEDFWKMISGIGLPLVLTITIFNGVEQKKIDMAKILFEHKMITTTTNVTKPQN